MPEWKQCSLFSLAAFVVWITSFLRKNSQKNLFLFSTFCTMPLLCDFSYLSSNRKVSVNTVEAYLRALTNSYIIYKVSRYDIKGRQYLKTLFCWQWYKKPAYKPIRKRSGTSAWEYSISWTFEKVQQSKYRQTCGKRSGFCCCKYERNRILSSLCKRTWREDPPPWTGSASRNTW